MAKPVLEAPTKFVVEYFAEDKKLDSRWHYDYAKTKHGPVLVEDLSSLGKSKKKKGTKER